MHFWKFNNYDGELGGVEEHRKAPADYQEGEQPSHDKCWLIDCPCWHDGSSLYADVFFPILKFEGEEGVYRQLELEYRNRFARTQSEGD